MAGLNVGTAWLDIKPSAKGFSNNLGREIDGPMVAAGRGGGQKLASGVEEGAKPGFAAAGKGFAGALVAGFAIVGASQIVSTVTDYLSSAVSAASDLNETVNKSNAIFGENAATVEKWANTAATSVGLSKSAALDAAAGFGDMFLQLGFAGSEATKMSTAVVQMSADLGSFNNLPTAEVADMISAAFRGEYDSLQRLIPNINAARVESEALAATGKTTASSLTAQEKAAAVLAIVQKDGARAMGDFAKTSDSLANSTKIVQAEFENVKAEIGTALLPIVTDLMNFFREEGVPALQDFAKWVTENKDEIREFATQTADGALTVGAGILEMAAFFSRGFGTITAVAGIFLNFILETFSTILAGADRAFGWIPGIGPKISKANDDFSNFRTETNEKIASIANGFYAASGALDTFASGFDRIREKLRALDGASATISVNAQGDAIRALADGSYRVGNNMGFRAEGGPVVAGRPYIVGEREAELFVPNQSGMIYNQRQLAAMASGASMPSRVALLDADGSILANARVIAGNAVTTAQAQARTTASRGQLRAMARS